MFRFETIGKSKQFYDFLKNEILGGEYKPGDRFPSIRQLAEKYGISKITVNSVLSSLVTEGLLYVEQGRGTFVAEKRPDIRLNKVMIGVMLFDFSLENNVEAEIFNSIQRNLKEDYFVIPYNSYNDTISFYKGLKGFVELDVDGMIIVPPTAEDYDAAVIQNIIKREIPMVTINRKIPGVEADFVYVDFEAVVYKATKYILDRGKKNIALFEHDSPSIAPRMLEGYKRAHREKDVPVREEHILFWSGNSKETVPDIKNLIRSIDGLVASDHLVYKMRKAIYESEKKIPEEISIVGINDTVYSRFMNPPLTAIPNPSAEIGREALKMIMERIEKKRTTSLERSFTAEIKVRST